MKDWYIFKCTQIQSFHTSSKRNLTTSPHYPRHITTHPTSGLDASALTKTGIPPYTLSNLLLEDWKKHERMKRNNYPKTIY